MSELIQQLIIGNVEDIPIQSSSNSQYKLILHGDTFRVNTKRSPGETGFAGEICWDVIENNASLFLCSVSASIDEDGEVLVPAVWNEVILTRMV